MAPDTSIDAVGDRLHDQATADVRGQARAGCGLSTGALCLFLSYGVSCFRIQKREL